MDRLRRLGGGLRSWLAVRFTRTAALYFTSPTLLRLLRRQPGTQGEAGGSTKRPVERGCESGERNGSERVKVASVAEGNPPRAGAPSLRARPVARTSSQGRGRSRFLGRGGAGDGI